MDWNWDISNNYSFQPENNKTSERYVFKSALHTFEAVVDRTMNTVKIGGKYPDCVNMTLEYNNKKNTAFIGFVQSEPECSLDTYMKDGEGSEMLRASIQFVKHVNPEIQFVRLDDMSRIDCQKSPTRSGKPRKQIQPFSLPHLSIATSGYTWYEKQFGAMFMNEERHAQYRAKIRNLNAIVDIPFDTFVRRYELTPHQEKLLSPYYTVGNPDGIQSVSDEWISDKQRNNWLNLFRKIPANKRCEIFFNWIETCIMDLTHDAFRSMYWIIDIDRMAKTTMVIQDAQEGGSKRRRFTRRRQKRRGLTISNPYYHTIL